MFSVAIIGTLFFCGVAMYLHWSPFASLRLYEGLLRFSLPAGSWSREKIREILGRYCSSAILVAMREAVQGDAIEYSYQVKLLDPSFHADLLDALRAVEDISDVNLLMHRATVESMIDKPYSRYPRHPAVEEPKRCWPVHLAGGDRARHGALFPRRAVRRHERHGGGDPRGDRR